MFDFNTSQYLVQNMVLVLTVILSAASVVLVLVLVGIQIAAPIRKTRRERWLILWRREVLQSVAGDMQAVSSLPRSRKKAFFRLRAWHDIRARLRGESTEGLRRFAQLNGVERTAQKLLHSRNLYKRLLAIESLGYLRCMEESSGLERMMKEKNPYTSLAAAWALVRIDKTHHTASVLKEMAKRMDWSVNQARLMLYDMERENVRVAAETILETASPQEQARLLNVCNVVYPYLMADVVYARIERAGSWAVIPDIVAVQYLKTFRRRRALPFVQECLRHPYPPARAAAAEALGRFGKEEELPLLQAFLDDEEWLVRSTAAKTLCEMPMITQDRLKNIALHSHSKRAGETMQHILSEHPRFADKRVLLKSGHQQ